MESHNWTLAPVGIERADAGVDRPERGEPATPRRSRHRRGSGPTRSVALTGTGAAPQLQRGAVGEARLGGVHAAAAARAERPEVVVVDPGAVPHLFGLRRRVHRVHVRLPRRQDHALVARGVTGEQ